MALICGDEALARFRQGLSGERALELLEANGGRLLVQLPVGIGKSDWMDRITIEAREVYDLIVVLTPTRRLIEERRPFIDPPPGVKVVNLRPRPAQSCGPDRDRAWKRYESRDLTALGRAEICDPCPLRAQCFWPEQYGEGLEGAGLIYGTQAHLTRAAGFIDMLGHRAGAGRVLTLIDESNVIATPARSIILAPDLRRFLEALKAAAFDDEVLAQYHGRWISLVEALRHASTADLQDGNWRFPGVRADWAARVQRAGVERSGEAFRFLGFALNHLSSSLIETRRRGGSGQLEFSNRLIVGDVVVFSGTTDAGFARFRLGVDLASPFAGHRFIHPGSRFYNLASSIGTRTHFPGNAPQILDFFAALVARRAAEGRRVLLVARKPLVPSCVAGMDSRFAELRLDLRVQAGGWTPESLRDPRVVPLISYGMIGTNLFQDFDAAYCLTGFYVDESALAECVQDLTRRDLQVPITIETVGVPKRRRARVVDPDHRDFDVARLAQPALEFLEHGVVVQAVGRVRPFTRPREIFTLQMAELPGVTYDAEFNSLGEARRFFGIPTGREWRKAARAARIAELRRQGCTQAETARRLGISERTVRAHEGSEGGNSPFQNKSVLY